MRDAGDGARITYDLVLRLYADYRADLPIIVASYEGVRAGLELRDYYAYDLLYRDAC